MPGERATQSHHDIDPVRGQPSIGDPSPRKGCPHAKNEPAYPPEFRQEAVHRARSGDISIRHIARDLGIADQTLLNWIAQADADEGRRSLDASSGLQH